MGFIENTCSVIGPGCQVHTTHVLLICPHQNMADKLLEAIFQSIWYAKIKNWSLRLRLIGLIGKCIGIYILKQQGILKIRAGTIWCWGLWWVQMKNKIWTNQAYFVTLKVIQKINNWIKIYTKLYLNTAVLIHYRVGTDFV